MNVKKIIISILMIMLCITAAGCGSRNDVVKTEPLTVLVTDAPGLGDKSFNDSAWEGCERAAEKMKVKVRCLEPDSENKIADNVNQAAIDEAAMIICAGSDQTSAVKRISAAHHDINFVLIDGEAVRKNVKCIKFDEQEGAFLAGVAAASETKTDVVGFVGGKDNKVINKFRYGFEAGVEAVNPDATVMAAYTGNFSDREDGRAAALKLKAEGADVVFHAAGACGKGVIQAAGEKNFMVIGCDTDQSSLDSEHVLCSVTKRVDNAVFDAIKENERGKFTAGIVEYGLKNGGMDISDKAENLTSKDEKNIKKWKKAIVKEKFVVPYDAASYAAFEVPEI